MLRRTVAGAAVLWAAAIPFAAIAANGALGPAAYPFAFVVYLIGSVVCHQLPARSFHLAATPLPVCARCSGIYLGAAWAAALLMATRRLSAGSADGRHIRIVLALAALPVAATLALEWFTGHDPGNVIRALSGLPLGAAVAWAVCGAPKK
jgi:uncharacterized membrane protein